MKANPPATSGPAADFDASRAGPPVRAEPADLEPSPMSMKFVPGVIAALSMALALAACTTPQERVQQREDLLAAAGFAVRPANTAARQQALGRLPPHHFVQRTHGDTVVYLYADPLVCDCLYLGSQEAYGRYRQERLQQRLLDQQQQIADEQQMNADRFEDGAWDWGLWGPGFYR